MTMSAMLNEALPRCIRLKKSASMDVTESRRLSAPLICMSLMRVRRLLRFWIWAVMISSLFLLSD